jgi:hypothetical protein
MGWVSWVLFESLPVLGAVLFTINFVLLVLWRRGGRPHPLLVGLVLSLVLLLVQAVVVTHRERADRVLSAIETDIERARSGALANVLVEDFRAGDLERAAFLESVDELLRRVQIRSVRRLMLEVTARADDRFTAEATYHADIMADVYAGAFLSSWAITFERREDQWRIAAIRPLRVGRLEEPSWQRLRGF